MHVLNKATLGIYDTVTLSGRDGGALLDWLNVNGYQTPSNALPVIASYASDGWVFVATRLNRPQATHRRGDLPPVAFTFKTERAVYPMRLTGVDNGPLAVELYVFGEGRAEATGFEVEYCGQPFQYRAPVAESRVESPEYDWFRGPKPGEYRFGMDEICWFAFPAAVTTKLTATLQTRDMKKDVWIRWKSFRETHPTLYSEEAAVNAALRLGVCVGVIGLLVAQLAAPRLSRRTVIRLVMLVGTLAVASCLLRLGTTRITVVQRAPHPRVARSHWSGVKIVFEW